MGNNTHIIMPHSGYRKLIVYKKSEIIYQGTVVFCRRFLNAYKDRTIDQMIQAARSCKQNIAEGSAASGSSKETEIKLTNVACATLDELLEDYNDYLNTHHACKWPANDEKKLLARTFAVEHLEWKQWEHIFQSRNSEICCNLLIIIIYQTRFLLDRLIRRQENDFLDYGGIRERMFYARKNIKNSTLESIIISKLNMAQTQAELLATAQNIMAHVKNTVETIRQNKHWQ